MRKHSASRKPPQRPPGPAPWDAHAASALEDLALVSPGDLCVLPWSLGPSVMTAADRAGARGQRDVQDTPAGCFWERIFTPSKLMLGEAGRGWGLGLGQADLEIQLSLRAV